MTCLISSDANDINLDRFMAFSSTSRTNDPFSICNVDINAENNILINQILIYPSIDGGYPHPVRAGMGGDLTITAKNILSTQDLSTFDPIYSPTIGSSGRIRFHAKEDLELGIMRFIPGNYNPNRDIVHEFKGQNIKFGIKTGDEFISSNTVVFDYENNEIPICFSPTEDSKGMMGTIFIVLNDNEIEIDGLEVQDIVIDRNSKKIKQLNDSSKPNC